MHLPRAETATVDERKVAAYLLNAAHPDNGGKSRFFDELGYKPSDSAKLARRVTATMPQAPISDPEINLTVVLAAGGVLLLGGLLAAIMPARHATRIHPVEALRAE